MNLADIKPQFILVIGGAGSGKNFFISRTYPSYTLIDIDAIKGEIGLDQGMQQIKPMMVSAFERKQNVAHPTTGANLKGQQNKIALAHKYGYSVTLVFIDTNPAKAIGNVRKRVRSGGHDVEIDDIVASNARARENFKVLRLLADNVKVIS